MLTPLLVLYSPRLTLSRGVNTAPPSCELSCLLLWMTVADNGPPSLLWHQAIFGLFPPCAQLCFLPLFTELFQFCVEVTPTPPWLQIYGLSHCQAIFAHLIIIGNNISLTAIFIVKTAAMTLPMANCHCWCIQKLGILITVCKKESMDNHQNILTTAPPPHPLSGEFFLAKEEHVFHTIEVGSPNIYWEIYISSAKDQRHKY